MPFTPFSAKNAKVRTGLLANTLTCKQWVVTPEADELDTTNFEGNGFYECIGGIKKATVTIDYDIDASQNHYDSLFGLPGSIIRETKLYWQNTSGPYWYLAYAMVKTTPNNMNVKEAGKGSVTLVGTATYVQPTGTFTPA